MKVLVTGGSGFLGTRLKGFYPNWIFVSSKDYDLLSSKETEKMLKDIYPDAVIHLAAKVGGIKENVEKQEEFFYVNSMMNLNVVRSCIKTGVKRVLASLSTCAFPDDSSLVPFKEEDLHKGKPALSNLSYGMSKRMLHTHCVAARDQYGLNYSCFTPSNIYGPHDHFDKPNSSHFVASLVSKISNAKDGDLLEFWGTGEPLRQQLYVDDLCDLMPWLLDNHNDDRPLIVAPSENISIKQMVDVAVKVSKKDIKYYFNNSLDGQYRKDAQSGVRYNFTSFKDGFQKTYKFYNENKK